MKTSLKSKGAAVFLKLPGVNFYLLRCHPISILWIIGAIEKTSVKANDHAVFPVEKTGVGCHRIFHVSSYNLDLFWFSWIKSTFHSRIHDKNSSLYSFTGILVICVLHTLKLSVMIQISGAQELVLNDK